MLEHLEAALTDWVSHDYELVTSAALVDVLRSIADDDPWDLWLILGTDRERDHLARVIFEHLRRDGRHYADHTASRRHRLAII